VVDTLDDCFKVQKNIMFEQACFNKRCQLQNESVEQYVTEVHRLGYNSEFGASKKNSTVIVW